MKKVIVSFIAAAIIAATAFVGGCVSFSGVDGRDGKDGQDVSIYECYELAKQEDPELTIEEFLKKYLSYSGDAVESGFSMQASINRSLFSAVSVAAGFEVSDTNIWGKPSGTKTSWMFGAGVIIDLDKERGDAYIVTNCHVIYTDASAGSRISKNVYLFLYGQDEDYDIRQYGIPATVIGASRTYDIAVLKVQGSEVLKGSNAVAAKFNGSDDVYAGEPVYAIGNPETLGVSATQGIISKESETISVNVSDVSTDVQQYRVLRTDAAINGGNSGGGLFNAEGELVGIVNAKAAESDIDNMGYALPASNVKRLVRLMIDTQSKFDGNNTGVYQFYLSAGLTAQGRKVRLENDRAVISETVCVNNAVSGLERDDAIRRIVIENASGEVVESREVTRLHHVEDLLLSAREGYNVKLTVSRAGGLVEVPIAVTQRDLDFVV